MVLESFKDNVFYLPNHSNINTYILKAIVHLDLLCLKIAIQSMQELSRDANVLQ